MDGTAQATADVLLADGSAVHVRPIRPDDGEALVAFHARLSADTVYLRFFSPKPVLTPRDVERFTHVDGDTRVALVALLGGEIIGVARYDRVPGTTEAEVAFVIEDHHQGRGLGTIFLEYLAALARGRGITRFVADTLPHNRRMLEVFRTAGFRVEQTYSDGVVRVTFPIEPTERSVEAMHERERTAAAHSIQRILEPRSVAVIGAGRERFTIGHEIFRNLIGGGFNGPVYPVNPRASHVASVRAYPSVLDIPDDVDLAVITVPAALVLDAVEQCVEKKVHGLVVITAGFAEAGADGATLERELVERARSGGMRMVGPNCMGVINTAAGVSLNATFAPVPPLPGRVAFSSQSGGLGIAILQRARDLGLGISSFTSLGNKADISSNDLLQYWENDANTDVILLYLESFGNPRSFSRIARRVSRRKPIVAVKGGRSSAGTRAASSHTAAMASPDTAVDALFLQTGVIRVDGLEQLFDVAQVLTNQPLPKGNRVCVLGNAGGPGILAADACEGAGLVVPSLGEATQQRLRALVPAAAAVQNPVDLLASASAADYEQAIRAVVESAEVDAVLVTFVPPLVTRADDVASAVARAAAGASKPVIATFLGESGTPLPLREDRHHVPSFPFPEQAAYALAAAVRYASWRERPEGVVPELAGVDTGAARRIVAAHLDAHPEGGWLDAAPATDLLCTYGICVAPTRRAASLDEGVAAASAVGYPVVLKAGSPELVHKSDVGGVRVGIRDDTELRRAYAEMETRLGERMGGAVVQNQVPPGVETIVGVVQDRSFGPLVMFGTGGTAVELLQDRAFRIVPMTDLDAHELVRAPRGAPLLFGFRGTPKADVDALENLLVRVGRLVDEVPEIAEMDLNPVIAASDGATAVDVKLRLQPATPSPDLPMRRLR
jgi:acetyl coenzyme A synthetase (ADP forming)-like protein